MRRDSSNSHSIEDLVAAAKSPDAPETLAKVEPRQLKEIEEFITTSGIKSGRKKIHSLVVYGVYVELTKTDTHLTTKDFINGIGYFFPKVYNKQKNICFMLSPKYNQGKFIPGLKHLKELRTKYGKLKSRKIKNEILHE